MAGTAWQDAETARRFVEERQSLVPFGAEQIRMLLQLVEYFRPRPKLVLDLGCGDGILARGLLDVYPEAHAVLLEHSEPMLERARAAARKYAGRCEIHWADLAQPVTELLAGRRPDLVVSGYAIHHLPHVDKRMLYDEVFRLLEPGGLFVNLEHVASATPTLERLFETLYVDFTASVSGRPRSEVESEFQGAVDRSDNILLDVETQLAWLRELGFQQVDCYFKWLELAVFGGVRPAV
jgi:ubiquinone/menaquinone biosynthesis C-methylase UbiE